MSRKLLAMAAVLAGALTAAADPVATLGLSSPQDGKALVAGAAVHWAVHVAVSSGDCEGLALVCVDLAQKASNPALFDLPPGDADSLDATMTNFSRPAGISNPGEGGAVSGYIGVQRGEAGRRDLVQIGGAQNTFGKAGTVIGTSVDVIPAVGQGQNPQLVLSGQFAAPAAPGTYVFELKNGRANVLESVQPPPVFSPVVAAAVVLEPATFSFSVSSFALGDVDCSGAIDAFDIDPFVLALTNPEAYELAYPDCDLALADLNQDGKVDAFDIDPFVEALIGP